MADSDKKLNGVGVGELLSNVKMLKADLVEIEKATKKQALIARVGLLVMLFAVLFFTFNIWNFSRSLMKPESLDKFEKRFGQDMQDLMRDPDVKQIEENLIKQVLPELTNQVVARFKKELPSFKGKGEKVLDNLKTHVEEYVKTELEKALADSLAEVEMEIQTKYPTVSAEKLDKSLKAAEDVFVEHLSTTLENRFTLAYNDFMKTENTIKKFSYLEDTTRLEGMKTDDIKLEILESFLELGIYEINPIKGNKVAETQGGVK